MLTKNELFHVFSSGGDKKAITMGGEVLTDTIFTGRLILLFKNFQVKIMGGAGLTSNLDRPNMPGNN